MDAKQLEDLAARLGAALPPGAKTLRRELEENFRAILRANLEKWDLVSRERFDAQAAVLARTQQKLKTLEQRLLDLERRAGAP
jgi:ubiquinone biosynthesis accessory factor UbiK